MLLTTVSNTTQGFKFVVTDEESGDILFEGVWGKDIPEGMTQEAYLLKYKAEAELLANEEKVRRNPPQEISLPI